MEPIDPEYRKLLWQYRADIQSIQLKSQNEYDRTIVLVSSGGLVATIGFFDKIPIGTPMHMIFTSWVLWSLSLIAVIGSHAAAVNSLNKTVDELDRFLDCTFGNQFIAPKSKWRIVLTSCNYGSFWLLVSAIIYCGTAIGIGILSPKKIKNEQQQTIERAEGIHSTSTTTETSEIRGAVRANGGTSDAKPTTEAEKVITAEE